MLNKLLWIICGFIFVLGLVLIYNQKSFFNKKAETKKISGESNLNLSINDKDQIAEIPQKRAEFVEPLIFAKSVYVVDIPSLYPLYAKNEKEKVPIASTTKIATALVVLENYPDKLSDIVTISSKMILVEGSDIQLQIGEKISVENLLNGLLIMSGNDTAYALADYFGGKDNFVKEMNNKISQIGLYNTKYKDPAGLDDEGNSTARDLAILGSYALRNKNFAEIVKTPQKTIYSADGKIAHELKSSNRLLLSEELFYYQYAVGIKTGFTNAAGHVLISAAEKNGHKILAVVLNTNENSVVASAKESKKILEWAFENWSWE